MGSLVCRTEVDRGSGRLRHCTFGAPLYQDSQNGIHSLQRTKSICIDSIARNGKHLANVSLEVRLMSQPGKDGILSHHIGMMKSPSNAVN